MATRKTSVILKNELKSLERKIKDSKNQLKNLIGTAKNEFDLSLIEFYETELKFYESKKQKIMSFDCPFENIKSELSEMLITVATGNASLEMLNDLIGFKTLNKSPYSDSFYDSKDISWGHKPIGSLRVSDHWDFVSCDTVHCKTDIDLVDGWALGEFDGEKYIILKKY